MLTYACCSNCREIPRKAPPHPPSSVKDNLTRFGERPLLGHGEKLEMAEEEPLRKKNAHSLFQ